VATTLLLGILVASPAWAQQPSAQHVVLIVTDGFRWQELFCGADSALINEEYGQVEDTASVRRAYLVGDAAANRQALMPFMWGVVAKDGQIYGNRNLGSTAVVTNGFKFSYPGYNEMLTGKPDPRIDKNDYGPNPNVTVFEWLAGQPELQGKIAAFGTWDAFAPIFNRDRAPMLVEAGWDQPFPASTVPARVLLDTLYATTTRVWQEMPYDAFMQAVVREYLATDHPHALYLGYGETDEWAHEGRYDQYLAAAHRVDGFVRDLWQAMQAMPEYAGKTTFIITTDHGRGSGLKEWRNHGAKVEGAEYIWVAVMGPNTPALGERRGVPTVTQSQIAATVAAPLGLDWAAVSGAAKPLPVFGGKD
jgi:hypothetical protein